MTCSFSEKQPFQNHLLIITLCLRKTNRRKWEREGTYYGKQRTKSRKTRVLHCSKCVMLLFVFLIIIYLGILSEFRNIQPLTVDYKLEMTWKKTVVAYFEVLFRRFLSQDTVIRPGFETRTYCMQARKPAS